MSGYAINTELWKATFAAARRPGKSALVDAWHREMDEYKYKQRWAAVQQFYHGQPSVRTDPKATWSGFTSTEGSDVDQAFLSAKMVASAGAQRVEAGSLLRVDRVEINGDEMVAVVSSADSCIPHNTDMIPAEQHYRDVAALNNKIDQLEKRTTDLSCELSAARAERDEAKGLSGLLRDSREEMLRRQLADAAGASWEALRDASALEDENRALRYQLSIAESKRNPARHRPGEQVSVGWDPEGD